MAFTAGNWGQGRLLTGLAPGSSLSGYAAVITKDNLPTSALDGGSLSCLNGGGDWRFSTDINGATQLPVEILTCVTSATVGNTELIAWIRFPTYASGTREVYAFWNKAGESQPLPGATFGSEEVWQDYEAVIHANDAGTNGVFADSTGNGHGSTLTTGASLGTSATNPIGGSWPDFTQSEVISLGNTAATLNGASNFTVQALANHDQSSGSVGLIGNRYSSPDTNWASIQASAKLATKGASSENFYDSGTQQPTGVNYWRTLTQSAAALRGYTNGSLDGADTTIVGLPLSTGTGDFRVGTYYDNSSSRRYNGRTAEFRIILSELSADQVSIEYDNQSSPSTFWTAGTVFVPSGGGSSIPVTKTQRGSAVIASGQTSVTLTNGTDYTLTDTDDTKWFCRITNNHFTGSGATSGGGTQQPDRSTTHIVRTGANTTFTRASSSGDCRVDWEVIEVVCLAGDPNEFVIHEKPTIAFAAGVSSQAFSYSGVTDANQVAVLITSQSANSSSQNDYNEMLFTATRGATGYTVQRGDPTGAANVSIAVVEFVGSNWTVTQESFSGNVINGTSSVTLGTSVSDITKTFTHVQYRIESTAAQGLDDISVRVHLSSTTALAVASKTATGSSSKYHNVYLIQNPELVVDRKTGTMSGTGSEEVQNIPVTAVVDMARAALFGLSADSTGSGTAFPRGFIGFNLTSTTNLRIVQSDNGQTSLYAGEVVTFPLSSYSPGGGTTTPLVLGYLAVGSSALANQLTLGRLLAYSAAGNCELTKQLELGRILSYSATGEGELSKQLELKRVLAHLAVGGLSLEQRLTLSRDLNYLVTGTAALAIGAATFTVANSYTATGTSTMFKVLGKVLSYVGLGTYTQPAKSLGVTKTYTATGTLTQEESLVTEVSLSYTALGLLTAATLYIPKQIGSAGRYLKRIAIKIGIGV
jgi:hypothetical protein